MISSTKPSFRKRYSRLSPELQKAARDAFLLWQKDPWHRSLFFKEVNGYWSVRVADSFRALATPDGERVVWFWIGTHDEYNRILRG